MSNQISYLREERDTLEGELELLETYEKFKGNPDHDEESESLGMKELNNIEIKFGKSFLQKRIEWYNAEIEKEYKKEVA